MQRTLKNIAYFAMIAVIFSFFCVLLSSDTAFAQIRTLRGKVTDEAGKPIVGAEVDIQRTDVARNYKTKTEKDGSYIYTGLPFGTYRIVIRKEGFNPDFVQNLQPRLGEDRSYDFILKAGPGGKLAFELTKEELAQIEKQRGKADEVKKQSEEVKLLFTQGLDFAGKNQLPEALDAFQKALEKDPEQPNIWANLGDTQAKLNQLDKAVESFQKAIALKPDDAGLHQNLGVIYGKAGKTAEAQEEFKKAAEMNPGGAGAVNYFNLGATMVNSGKTPEAAEAFKKAIEADPAYAEAYYQLGLCYINLNKIPEAVEALKKYTEIGKNADQLATAKALVGEFSKVKK
jgi:tetratricopeptide (TPR) repeat protein